MKHFTGDEDELELSEDYIPTAEETRISEHLVRTGGNVAATAKSLALARVTIYRKLKASAYLRDVVDDCRESLLDEAESQLAAAIRKGEAWAVCFYLKTQGKNRGYIERGELHVEKRIMTVADLVRKAHEEEEAEKKRLGPNTWDDLILDTDKGD